MIVVWSMVVSILVNINRRILSEKDKKNAFRFLISEPLNLDYDLLIQKKNGQQSQRSQ